MGRFVALMRYTATRLGLAPLMLWVISTLVFVLLRVAPGDPVDAVLGSRAPATAKAVMRESLGLDVSFMEQYTNYIKNLLRGDLGHALINQEPVLNIIKRTLPASLELSVIALILAAVVGLSIGFSGIAKPEGKIDLAGRLYGLGTYALPPFWIAMLFQLLFSVSLGWLPVGGRFPPHLLPPNGTGFFLYDSILAGNWIAFQGSIRHLFLPAITLALLLSGTFTTALRLNLRRSLEADYVEAARCRGLSERQVVLKHGLPNALMQVLTISGITIASLIGGALLIEVTFSWPGIALKLQEAINQRDYPVVQGIVIIISTLVVIVSLVVDIIVASLDPRIRY
tara:strand:+ start:110 stop:1129 length:1020 start_codon:yes stop_codon:yes gene_type:complete